MKTFSIVSLGCPKNLVDSECIISRLSLDGLTWRPATSADEAGSDLVVINTCGFIESAKQESIDTIMEFVNKKKRKPFLLFVGGCLPQRYREEMKELIPEVDGWFGVEGFEAVSRLVKAHQAGEAAVLIEEPPAVYREAEGRTKVTPKAWAYVKIADGCNHRCSFCAIPAIRGPYRSRQKETVVGEVRQLVQQGTREVILIAQDTALYGRDLTRKRGLPELLRELNGLEGLKWIRLLYLNPFSIDDELIESVASLDRVVKYLDIPFQHCSEDILRRMARPGSGESHLALIGRLRGSIPGLALRSSFILGYPGEKDSHFKELMSFLREARLNRAGFFTYSREEGTPSCRERNQVKASVKQRRYQMAMSFQQEISREVNRERMNCRIPVLVERSKSPGDRAFLKGIAGELGNSIKGSDLNRSARCFGRTEWDAPDIDGIAVVTGDEKESPTLRPGDFAEIEVKAVTSCDVVGNAVVAEGSR